MWTQQHKPDGRGTTQAPTGHDLVPVVFAQTVEQASRYSSFLEAVDIPPLVCTDLSEDGEESGRGGRPVLVAGDSHERACEILASQAAQVRHDFDDDNDPFDDDDQDDDLDDDDDFDPDKDDDDFDLDDDFDDDERFPSLDRAPS